MRFNTGYADDSADGKGRVGKVVLLTNIKPNRGTYKKTTQPRADLDGLCWDWYYGGQKSAAHPTRLNLNESHQYQYYG
jgi:hypothetical protein